MRIGMTKYTINKAFEKNFPYPIWKIEMDCEHSMLALECRQIDNTFPVVYVLDFNGNTLLNEYNLDAKEWTLESIQGDYLIFKKFGSYSPIQSGIKVIHIPSKTQCFEYMEYVIKEVYQGVIQAFHRSIPSGIYFYIDIMTGDISNTSNSNLQYPHRDINYPIPYQRNLPTFMRDINYIDQIWLQPYNDLFLWSYHSKSEHQYHLNLTLSSKNEVFDSKIILNGIDKLIPQPYFTVKDKIFFLSGNKMNISAYLV